MTKSILILEFYQLNIPTNGTLNVCYWGLKVAREDKVMDFHGKEKKLFTETGRKGIQIQIEKKIKYCQMVTEVSWLQMA